MKEKLSLLEDDLDQTVSQNDIYEDKMTQLMRHNDELKKAMMLIQAKYLEQNKEIQQVAEDKARLERTLTKYKGGAGVMDETGGDDAYFEKIVKERDYFKDLTEKLKERLERVIKDLEFYRQKLRQLDK